jgi:hypothetical protein
MAGHLWCSANVDGKKKSDEEAKKKQRIGLKEELALSSHPRAEFQNIRCARWTIHTTI